MNILLAIEGQEKQKNSTFTLISFKEKQLFLQFSPDFHLQSLTLGDIFFESGIEGVKQIFQQNFQVPIDGYVLITEENLLQLMQIYFPKGIPDLQAASQKILAVQQLAACLDYQNNLEGEHSTFAYQRHFLTLLKRQIVRKRNLLKMTPIMKQLAQFVETDIPQQQWVKLVIAAIGKNQRPTLDYIFPIENTYRIMPVGSRYRLKMVDVSSNEGFLRRIFQEELLKGS